jgi:DNA-binding NarL/FixJ family response regulator
LVDHPRWGIKPKRESSQKGGGECHEGTMHRERTLAARVENLSRRAESEPARQREILFLDTQALTRSCIARELGRKLPEFKIVEHAFVQELVASEDLCLSNVTVAILFVHRSPGSDADHDTVSLELNALERAAPAIPRVLLSEVEVPEDILEAFRHRVRGYVPTTLPIEQMAEVIRFVAAGGTFVPPSILSLHAGPSVHLERPPLSPDVNAAIAHFSPRQNQVLRMLWKGCSNKLIAYELRMCESTVKVHIRHIMKKLNVSNRTQVVLRTRPQLFNRDNRDGVEFSASDSGSMKHVPAANGVPAPVIGQLDGPGGGDAPRFTGGSGGRLR